MMGVECQRAKRCKRQTRGTGWWSEEHGGPGETLVHICINYVDENGKSRAWHYGFLVHDKGEVMY